MPRSTRSRLGSTSSQSRSRKVDAQSSPLISTVPPRYTVSLAVPPSKRPLNGEEAKREYVRGAEFLSDAWRYDEEARVEESTSVLKTRRRDIRADDGLVKCSSHDFRPTCAPPNRASWYTAAWRYPCTCGLQSWRGGWTPPIPPPKTHTLASLPPHPNPSLIPLVGPNIPVWSINPLADLEPALDVLDEFISTWRDAIGSGWGVGALPTSWEMECDEIEVEQETNSVETAVETPQTRKRRKGKERAKLHMTTVPPIDQLTTKVNLRGTRDTPSDRISMDPVAVERFGQAPLEQIWKDECRHRKAWWRSEVGSSSSYGQLWSIIPRPHALDSPVSSVKRKKPHRPPNYILPRFYMNPSRHPFHPDLKRYLVDQPLARVYWVIPIHGPVHFPHYSNHLLSPPPTAPIPSRAYLTSQLPIQKAVTKPRPIIWTPALLKHFWKSFIMVLNQDPSRPFGSLSIRLSGPKPDPFLALRPAQSLPRWPPAGADQPATSPERPEMGDHMRIYCDAKWALSLRTWLHAIEIDLDALKTEVSENGGKEERHGQIGLYRPFDKARLVLVGERGEALAVA